ncbi:FAD-dependent oxidoreductase [Shewanella sedimentimangrovi]|uniref:dihydrouracil dehydrogenase (NAD(+)) n=1 Tax=Shewanella sedimentimangrovi TaxID=2814293 RepID=A0ABX7R099_9GAMM|nr:FAD-dependent oxidoreductase [Shewanella sedimentimangrovi]QSX36727.1 FAD-dependent oxidoreductase [Shewanella sedimentimangrovi]
MNKTDISGVQYFHKVVDCQYACPAHTPVPEYIRLIAERRYTEAYMVNWRSNVFPGILGRVCDRPCEPACRRGRVEEQPVAICRLKRVTADYKDEITGLLPKIPTQKNGRHIALIGAGPASLTVARDLLPLGYEITLFDRDPKAGGMMRSQIPAFRLPVEVLDEETDLVLNMGLNCRFGVEMTSMASLLEQPFDAIFVGTGAPKGKDMRIPGRDEADEWVHIGIDWLAGVNFGHIDSIGKKVLVLGGGNTAMDCCRTAKRLGGEDVKVVVRSTFEAMKASPWEKEDAAAEGVEIICEHTPREFVLEDGKLKGVLFDEVKSVYDSRGQRELVPSGKTLMLECDAVLCAVGQDNAFPWIERDLGIEFNRWDLPKLNKLSLQSTLPRVFFGGDAAFGPKNIITAVAHGHQAAISIDLYCQGEDPAVRPDSDYQLVSQKMGIHEWSYQSAIDHGARKAVPHLDWQEAVAQLSAEVELGYDERLALQEAHRCLNCDVQTVFEEARCIECSACEDICPMDCINFVDNGPDEQVKAALRVPELNPDQALYVSGALKTGQIMVKDEDVCLHCGLCAERCPTGAWDMQKFSIDNLEAVIK